MMHITEAEAAAMGIPGAKRKAHGRHIPGQMNRNERAYEAHLEMRLRADEVSWYKFEAVTFKLADDTRFTPDFLVMLVSGELQAHEVKGRKKDGRGGFKAWAPEDSHIKIKVAAALFPLQFVRVIQLPDGRWQEEAF